MFHTSTTSKFQFGGVSDRSPWMLKRTKKAPAKIPNILNPKTWVRFRPALCRGCWAGCCTLPVKVSTEDLFHMGFLKVDEVNRPLQPLFEKLKKQGIVRRLNQRSAVFTLAEKGNGDCIFLTELRRCSIYSNRPSVCRAFPFNSARPGYCPSQKKSQK